MSTWKTLAKVFKICFKLDMVTVYVHPPLFLPEHHNGAQKCIGTKYFIRGKRPWLCDSKLDPKLSEAEEFDLIKTATECVYPLPKEGGGVAKKGKEETEVEFEVLLESSVEALHDLLKELLKKDLTTDGLDSIFKVNACNVHCTAYMDCLFKMDPG